MLTAQRCCSSATRRTGRGRTGSLGLLAVSSAVSLSLLYGMGRIIDLVTHTGSGDGTPLPITSLVLGGTALFAVGSLAAFARTALMKVRGEAGAGDRGTSHRNPRGRSALTTVHGGFGCGDNVPHAASWRASAWCATSAATCTRRSCRKNSPSLTVIGQANSSTVSAPTPRWSPRASPTISWMAAARSCRPSLVPALGACARARTRPGHTVLTVGVGARERRAHLARPRATVGVSLMVYISPQLALIMLSIVPPVAGGAVVYGRFVRRISKRTQDALADATKVAEER